MSNIKPGGMGNKGGAGKPTQFAGSMAEAIEDALNEILNNETPSMKILEVNTNSQEARDRRRLFVAIALGVTRYLKTNMDAFQILDALNNPTGDKIRLNTDPDPL